MFKHFITRDEAMSWEGIRRIIDLQSIKFAKQDSAIAKIILSNRKKVEMLLSLNDKQLEKIKETDMIDIDRAKTKSSKTPFVLVDGHFINGD